MESNPPIPCSSCGHENEREWLFCSACGASLRRICPHCGTENPGDAVFCVKCGRPGPEPAPRGTYIPAYEREGEHLATPPATDAEPPPAPAEACSLERNAPTAEAPRVTQPRNQPAPPVRSRESSFVRHTCPRCQHRNESESAFCVNCGLPLDEDASVRSSARSRRVEESVPPYQGFWIRVVGQSIDCVIASIIYVVLLNVLDPSALLDSEGGGLFSLGIFLVLSLWWLVWITYSTIMVGAWGATLGKLTVGIRVRTVDQEPVGYGRALARHASLYACFLIFSVLLIAAILTVAFSSKRQGLHDMIAGTVVVKRRSRM